MKTRGRAYAVTLILVGLVASPLAGAFSMDSFPISTYPMFAATRSTEVSVPHVVLVGADGDEWAASPWDIASDEVLQAQATVRQALGRGDAATEALCERVAQRVEGSDAVSVMIVTSRYDAIRYYQSDREPLDRTVHTMCEVRS